MHLLSKILIFPVLSIANMHLLARSLAAQLRSGDIITLSGDVGAGKTTFARSLIEALAPQVGEVTSPTFTLMQPYDVSLANGQQDTLWHLDLYRLKHPEETGGLGLEELWPHVTLIEWPEIIEKRLPPERLDIGFDFGDSENTRRLVFSGNEVWRQRLGRQRLKEIHESF